MVATKRDLLPATLGNEKLSQFLLRRLKEEGILVQGIVVCGDLAAHALSLIHILLRLSAGFL